MKLVSLILYKWQADNSLQLVNCSELSHFSWWYRSTVREHAKFHSRLLVNRTAPGRRSSVDFEQISVKCHSWVHPHGVAAAVLIDAEYPTRVAFSLMQEAIRIFLEQMGGKWEDAEKDLVLSCPEIDELFQRFQNPVDGDKLTRIEKDLEEVKSTVLQSMDDLLKRGESMDQLMQKSQDLSKKSYEFYQRAKKNNQCCQLY